MSEMQSPTQRGSDTLVTQSKAESAQDLSLGQAIALVWHLGYIIAIPAVAFGFGGAYADKAIGTSPLFLLLGLGAAMLLSFLGVKRKVQQVLGERQGRQ